MARFMFALGGTLLIFSGVYALALCINYVQRHNTPPTPTREYKLTPLPHNGMDEPAATIVATSSTSTQTVDTPTINQVTTVEETSFRYFEITSGCHLHLGTDCVSAYARADTTSAKRAQLRIGSVLLLGESTTTSDGVLWHEIVFDEPLRYGERVTLPWYVKADNGVIHTRSGIQNLSTSTPTSTKSLLVDRDTQKMYAYEGDRLVRTYTISTGLELSPTPRGVFTIYRKTPTRYMQGPIPGINTKYYDLPGVPWNLYFTEQGAVVHGAYWHNSFGTQYSSGCVNVDPIEARELYDWADLGMTITIRD
jgi:hypothetical protein